MRKQMLFFWSIYIAATIAAYWFIHSAELTFALIAVMVVGIAGSQLDRLIVKQAPNQRAEERWKKIKQKLLF